MSHQTNNFRRLYIVVVLICFSSLVAGVGSAQEKKLEERYDAFGVAMGAGISGVLQITVTRYSTEEERKALVDSLAQNGQEKTIDLLRKQKETGFARTQTGAGMQGWPSSRLHYAHQTQQDGKRVVVLVTDRNMSMAEVTFIDHGSRKREGNHDESPAGALVVRGAANRSRRPIALAQTQETQHPRHLRRRHRHLERRRLLARHDGRTLRTSTASARRACSSPTTTASRAAPPAARRSSWGKCRSAPA